MGKRVGGWETGMVNTLGFYSNPEDFDRASIGLCSSDRSASLLSVWEHRGTRVYGLSQRKCRASGHGQRTLCYDISRDIRMDITATKQHCAPALLARSTSEAENYASL